MLMRSDSRRCLINLGLQQGADNPLLQFESLSLLGVGLWVPSLIGILLLLPPVRRLLARFIPIYAASPVHAVALSLSVLVIMQLLFTMGMGLNNLADMLAEQAGSPVSPRTRCWVFGCNNS